MIKAAGAIGFGTARTPECEIGAPPAALHFEEESLCVMRVDTAFEAVEDENVWCAWRGVIARCVEAMDVDEITVGSIKAVDVCGDERMTAGETAPECL